jgi:hypothetical protein
MADDVMSLVTTALQQITEGQRETVSLLRQMTEKIMDLSARLDRIEESLAAERRSPPVHPELPE